jgi:hypothetical protein
MAASKEEVLWELIIYAAVELQDDCGKLERKGATRVTSEAKEDRER